MQKESLILWGKLDSHFEHVKFEEPVGRAMVKSSGK